MNNNKTDELPMNWWKWWQYVMFPIGILISIGSLTQYSSVDFSILNLWGWIIVIVNLAITTLLCVTYGMFLTKKKQAFNVFITYLFLYPAWNTFVTTVNSAFSNNINNLPTNITELVITGLISYGIICGIWIYPNYIYFKKRKHFFSKREEKQQDINQDKEDKELENMISNIQKEQNNEIRETEKDADNKDEDKEKMNKKYCTKCGKIIDDNWAFCNYCGNKLK